MRLFCCAPSIASFYLPKSPRIITGCFVENWLVKRFSITTNKRHALDVMEQQKGGTLSDDQAMALGLEAQRWARRQKPKPRAKRK